MNVKDEVKRNPFFQFGIDDAENGANMLQRMIAEGESHENKVAYVLGRSQVIMQQLKDKMAKRIIEIMLDEVQGED